MPLKLHLLPYEKHVIELFNRGVLSNVSKNWYIKKGYTFIYSSDKLEHIAKVEESGMIEVEKC